MLLKLMMGIYSNAHSNSVKKVDAVGVEEFQIRILQVLSVLLAKKNNIKWNLQRNKLNEKIFFMIVDIKTQALHKIYLVRL